MLSARNIHYQAGGNPILNGIGINFEPGKLHVILGPNGSGKSSFLKICAGEITRYEGEVQYGTLNLHGIAPAQLARYRAVMSQQTELPFPLSVEEVVMMGRYPHFRYEPQLRDEKICNEVMQQLQLREYAQRNYMTLSGGEKQRVQFARVLTQIWEPAPNEHRYLFLDEPLNSLDIQYQHEFLRLTRKLVTPNTTIIAVLHDLNLSIQYADRLFFIKGGKGIAEGAPREIISRELVSMVFEVNTEIITHPQTGQPLVIFQ
jgi:iron complex transport system ATP-binding protein